MKGSVEAVAGIALLAVVLYLAYKAFTSYGAQSYINSQKTLSWLQSSVPLGSVNALTAVTNPLNNGGMYLAYPNQTIDPQATALIPSVS